MNPSSSLFVISISAMIIAPLTNAKGSRGSWKPRFISFDSKGGDIEVDLDLSVPFLSIPLDHKADSDGRPPALVNINTMGITIAGLLTATAAWLIPLFYKSPMSGQHFRLDDHPSFWEMGNSVNDFLFGNEKVTPCIQRAVCTVVAKVSRSDNPTSNDKIIDGIISHKWFANVTNGTTIQEAVAIGRGFNPDCSAIYKRCSMPAQIFDNILDEYGGF